MPKQVIHPHNKKTAIHSSCETEDFVEAHVCEVWYSDRAYYGVFVLNRDIVRRRDPLELQCSFHQGQQGDATQPVRGRFNAYIIAEAIHASAETNYKYMNS